MNKIKNGLAGVLKFKESAFEAHPNFAMYFKREF
jgi:hypothetical protein